MPVQPVARDLPPSAPAKGPLSSRQFGSALDIFGSSAPPLVINPNEPVAKPKDMKEGDVPPVVGDIKKSSIDANAGVITFTNHDGDFSVSQKDAPILYGQVKAAVTSQMALDKAEGRGYALVDAGMAPSIKVGDPPKADSPDVVEFYDNDGKKFVVTQESNPVVFANVMSSIEHGPGGSDNYLNDLRAKSGVDKEGDLNVLGKQAPDGKGSVQQEAMLNLYNKYSDDVKNGKVAGDSAEAKFVNAMDAETALSQGYQLLPYQEIAKPGVSGTWQHFSSPVTLTGADMQQMIDPAKTQALLAEAMSDKGVSKDYTSQVNDLLKGVPGSDKAADRLYDQLTGDGYIKFLNDAKDSGLAPEAQDQMRTDIAALSALDPERGAKAGQMLMMNSITYDIDKLSSKPQDIPAGALGASVADLFSLIRGQVTGTAVNLPRAVVGAINELYDALGGEGDLTKLQQNLGTLFQKLGNPTADGSIGDAAIEQAVGTVSGPQKSKALESLQQLNKVGLLGSICGASSLVGAIGITVLGKNTPATPGTRTAQAAAWLSFLSFSPAYVKLANTLIKSPQGQNIVDMLGLSKSLPDIWGKGGSVGAHLQSPAPTGGASPSEVPLHSQPSGGASPSQVPLPDSPPSGGGSPSQVPLPDSPPLGGGSPSQVPLPDSPPSGGASPSEVPLPDSPPSGGSTPGPMSTQDLLNGVGDRLNELIARLPPGQAPGAADPGAGTPPQGAAQLEQVAQQGLDDLHVKVPATTLSKIAATVAKTLGSLGDLGGGIAGIVGGALDLKTATNPLQKAADGLGIAGGAFGTVAGAIETAGLIGVSVAAGSLIVSTAFAASALLAVAGFIISDFLAHSKQSDAAKAQGDFFDKLDKSGLMQAGWRDKLEYARYETDSYSGRDTPADVSIFNYQSAEFQHFVATPGENGSSSNRLDPALHRHFDAPAPDPNGGAGENGNPPGVRWEH